MRRSQNRRKRVKNAPPGTVREKAARDTPAQPQRRFVIRWPVFRGRPDGALTHVPRSAASSGWAQVRGLVRPLALRVPSTAGHSSGLPDAEEELLRIARSGHSQRRNADVADEVAYPCDRPVLSRNRKKQKDPCGQISVVKGAVKTLEVLRKSARRGPGAPASGRQGAFHGGGGRVALRTASHVRV